MICPGVVFKCPKPRDIKFTVEKDKRKTAKIHLSEIITNTYLAFLLKKIKIVYLLIIRYSKEHRLLYTLNIYSE